MNELIDAISDGETIFLVQGSRGRRPIIADTAELAGARYMEIMNPVFVEETEEVNEEETQARELYPIASAYVWRGKKS